MRYTIVTLLLLSGCTALVPPKTMNLRDAEAICATSGSFERHAACVKSTFEAGYPNWRTIDRDSDLLALYFQWMEVASLKVREGALHEADANLQGSIVYSQVIQIGMERNAQARASQQTQLANTVLGLSLLQAAHPSPAPIPPPTYCSSRPVGNTVQTVCR